MEQWFDKYEIKARLAPALIVLLPIILVVYIMFPTVRDLATGIFSLMIVVALSTLLANVARTHGKNKEANLIKQWGGLPSTTFLRHRDRNIDKITKARYHAYLSTRIPGLSIPSADEESQDTTHADLVYSSAVKWLLKNTRDDQLLLKSNIAYGFARNLWAMKSIGITSCLIAMVVSVLIIIIRKTPLSEIPAEVWWGNAFILALLFNWIFVVKPDWVHMKAKAYAHVLLQKCDEPNQSEGQSQ